MRTIKALLLNGAVKPQGWAANYDCVVNSTYTSQTLTYLAPSNITATPLDSRYGAGVVNALNPYENLAAGITSSAANGALSRDDSRVLGEGIQPGEARRSQR